MDNLPVYLDDHFDKMFVRTIYCNPFNEFKIKSSVRADDIRVFTSNYIERNTYLCSKDIERKLIKMQLGWHSPMLECPDFEIMITEEFY